MRDWLGTALTVVVMLGMLLLVLYLAGKEISSHNVEQCVKLCEGHVRQLSYGSCTCAAKEAP